MEIKIWAQDGVLKGEGRGEGVRREETKTYLALKLADQQSLEDLARLVRVADVLEGLGRVLAAYVEHDFLATAVKALASCSPHTCVRVCALRGTVRVRVRVRACVRVSASPARPLRAHVSIATIHRHMCRYTHVSSVPSR
jgi:hypothetical protein